MTHARTLRAGFFLPGIICVSAARAGVRVNLITVEGDAVAGQIAAVDPEHVTVTAKDQRHTLRRRDLMRIDFPDAQPFRPSTDDRLRPIHLTDGGLLRGWVAGSDRDGLRLDVPELGNQPRRFPYSSLAGIRIAAKAHDRAEVIFQQHLAQRKPGQDVVVILKDDEVHTFKGSVESLTPSGGRFALSGRELPLNIATLYAVVFAASPLEADAEMMTVELNTGERMTGRLVRGDERTCSFVLRGGGDPVVFPWLLVRRVVLRSERVAFLSDLEPTRVEHEPYLNVSWPMRRDRSASNQPIRLGGETYAKGLGVHSATTIAYALGGRYKQFAATIGLDEAVRPRGNVIFRVLADGKEVYHSGDVTGRDDPVNINVEVAGVHELRLIVDFGKDADLGDQADWADARVIR